MAKRNPAKRASSQNAFELPDGEYCLGPDAHGFEKRDGKIFVSPIRQREIDNLIAQRQGVSELVDTFTRFTSGIYAQISRDQRKWWDSVLSDLGLTAAGESMRKRIVYKDGCVTMKEAKQPEGSNE